MSTADNIIIPLSLGIVLGALFFGGLWLTVRKAVGSTYSALWFLASSLLRTGLVLAGFYYVADGHWQRLFICLLGFIAARFLVLSFTRSFEKKQTLLKN
jgi:F1F0 ATPase subunit 2